MPRSEPPRLTFPVYIDAGNVPADAREVAALLADCSEALKEEPCVLGNSSGKRHPRRATVVLKGARAETVAIWVHHGDSSVSYRELNFQTGDEASERWRAAGLVAASMLLVPERDSAPAPEPEPRRVADAAPPARPERRPQSRPDRRERLALSIAASSSLWASAAPALFGGALGVEVFPFAVPLGLSLTGGASKSAAQLAGVAGATRQSIGLGVVAVCLPRSVVHLMLRGELMRERLAVRATNSLGASDSGETWRSAGMLTLAPTLELGHRLSAQVGGQVALYDHAPLVTSGPTTLAQAARVSGSAFVGIRVGF